jgi:hypothetical protein
MIRVQLPFDTNEEHRRCFDAIDWLVDKFGHTSNLDHLNIPLHEFMSWRTMSVSAREIIMTFLDTSANWWFCNDLDYEAIGSRKNYQQYFIKDPHVAMMFKLTFA